MKEVAVVLPISGLSVRRLTIADQPVEDENPPESTPAEPLPKPEPETPSLSIAPESAYPDGKFGC